MDSVNLKTLAKKLNLSISTVSRALRDSHEISVKTKQKVLALAKALNYEPNPYAGSLRKQASRTIAVVIPEVANNFFSLAISGIEEIAQLKGYHVLIYLTHDRYDLELSIARHLASGRVDGILLSVSSESNDFLHLVELKNKNIPMVFFDRVCEEIDAPKVTTDDFESGYQATVHLIEMGCKSIAYLMIAKNLSIGQKRLEGYKEALKDNGHDFEERLVINCSNDKEVNYELIKGVLAGANRPDGIFASVEHLAIASYYACKDSGLSIPEDVKLVSFSNLETAPLLNPSLTTITQPAYLIGKEAATMLFRMLEKKPINIEDQHLELKSMLFQRESTA
ncbi:LacI family transcriptional regulator [Pedobacter sp. CG_S7]|uniref:LacI family DNA-binding transcriptional regulator n=1 Tax=Pedobacter sp. CG_S7 TaxID=3143930 RepID=UPI003395460A